jgi:hypothetical protein
LKSEHRRFRLHLCLNGHRAASRPVAAEVDPSFGSQAFTFAVGDLPTSGSEWELLVRKGGLLHLALTLEDGPALGRAEDGEAGAVSREVRRIRTEKAVRDLVATAAIDWGHVLTRNGQAFGLELQVRCASLQPRSPVMK